MRRGNRNVWDPAGRGTRGAAVLTVLAAVGCFAIVIGTLAIFRGQPATQASADTAPVPVEVRQASESDQLPIPPTADVSPNAPNSVIDTAITDTEVVQTAFVADAKEAPVADARQSRRELLEAQLAVGEFGPALATAETAASAAERAGLLKKIAEAQYQSGEFDAALASVRRAEPQRANAAQTSAAEELAGGSTGADFSQLIELIQQETSGEWVDTTGVGGTLTEFETGVRVNPNGLLATLTKAEMTGRLEALGLKSRVADLNDDMARRSKLRLVSLTRLEREVARRLKDGLPVVETMQQLAGLKTITHVFVYPEEREIVIGGPAEGWRYDETGRPVGIESGRSTLQLDDLVTVIRTFSQEGMGIFGCSINPRQEGLRDLKQYVEQSNARGPLQAGAQVRNWVNRLQSKLGLQDVELYGIPANSRVARVIVEADYRMKLIGIGKLDGGSNIPSFFDLLTEEEQKSSKMDALRWWLSMKYDSVQVSPDRNVFEIRGSSVLCQSENQFVTAQGERIQTGQAEATNRRFAENFTQHYQELAKRDLAFADLQNVFDLALVAAMMRQEGLNERIDWDLGVFAQNGAYQPARFEAPKTVDSVVNHRVYRGKDIVVQVAGGVRADLMSVVRSNALVQFAEQLSSIGEKSRAPQLPEGRWWWDAAN